MDRILLEFFVDYILPFVFGGLALVIIWGIWTEGGAVHPFKK